jgi:hypothetical protein
MATSNDRDPASDQDELRLAPAEGMSREELEQQFAEPLKLDEPGQPKRGPQFTVGDVMILMIGVAAGLAGGSWMPTDYFAAILGLVTLIGLLVVSWHPPETHFGKLIWSTLVLAYVIAVLAAVFRPAT